MNYYHVDLLMKCVIAQLTDDGEAQELIVSLGSRYGVIETDQALVEKPMSIPSGPDPSGSMSTAVDYGPLDVQGLAYTPFLVADVFDDYDIPEAEVHCNANRYDLVIDESGFVRDVTRILSGPPPKDFLQVTTDATDDNPPDGYPDIPADGASTCRIMIQKVNGQSGDDMVGAEDNETIQITTGAGRLSAVLANLVNGYAEVALTGSTDTVFTTVRAFDPSGQLAEGTLVIQFS